MASNDLKNGYADIGVITPYKAQMQLINDLLKAGGESEEGVDQVEVKTVDGYQGREKEVIILSTVRANDEGQIGFLRDRRRANVSLTRARRGLIVVGNQKTLMCDYLWNQWLRDIQRIGSCVIEESAIDDRSFPQLVPRKWKLNVFSDALAR